MKILFDTSVLIAALVEAHPAHARAFSWIKRVKARDLEFAVAMHTLAELYAVLTTLPLRPRISPETALRLIKENVESSAEIVPLSTSDYRSTLERMAELGLPGGVVHDCLIARAARKAGADRILTLNLADFERVWPEGRACLVEP